ncbi:hypothetical protein [Spirillospora sp. NPDC047279]|uniref:hypothetical protein n=1 Tax=Spirillospora sp. NPDC047279 TaxID=3155478 RepID=UPI0033CD398E
MSRAEQAAARLQRVKQLAERHGPALRHAFGVLLEDALIGPAGDRLFQGLAERHRDARSAFYAAFDAVERLAAQAEAGPPRLGEPYIPGPPRGGRRAPSDVRGGSPDALHRLGAELGRAGREWQDAGDALARILDGLGLSTSPAHSVSRAGRWVAAQQHDVHRRRDELIKADQQQALQAALGTVQGVARALGRPRESRNTVGIALNKTWNDYTRRYLPGVWTGTKDIGLAALASNPVTAPVYALEDWDSWLQRGPVGQVKGVVQGVQHPIAFAKAMIDWDEWKKDPLRAFGKTVPTLVISAVTFGTGTGAGAGAKAGTASTRFGKVQRSDADQPDSGKTWKGEGGLKLSASDNAAADRFIQRARTSEPAITSRMTNIADDVGAQMVGLREALKTEVSLKRKIATKLKIRTAWTIDDALASINDSVRYTMKLSDANYAGGVRQATHQLRAQGYELVPGSWKNTWGGAGYQGINSTWRDPRTGQIFEVQFHTQQSFWAKTVTHGLYKRIRLPGTSREEVSRLEREQDDIFDDVPVPDGAPDIGPD